MVKVWVQRHPSLWPFICLSAAQPGALVLVSFLTSSVSRLGFLTSALYPTGGRVKTWKRRWFILTDNCLYYFEFTTVSAFRPKSPPQYLTFLCFSYSVWFLQDKEPRGIIPLENLSIREVEDKKPVSPVSFDMVIALSHGGAKAWNPKLNAHLQLKSH